MLSTQIQITDTISIPRGNFPFVYDNTGIADLFEYCRLAEQYAYKDPLAAATNIRKALEVTGYYCKYKSDHPDAEPDTQDLIDALKEIKRETNETAMQGNNGSRANCKTYIRDYINKYQIWKSNEADALRDEVITPSVFQALNANRPDPRFADIVFYLYAEVSNSSHAGGTISPDEIVRLLEILFRFLHILFKDNSDPRLSPNSLYKKSPLEKSAFENGFESRLPAQEYYKLSGGQAKNLGIINLLPIYIKEEEGSISWYCLKAYNSNKAEFRRDIDSLCRIWDGIRNTPYGVLIPAEEVTTSKGRMRVFKFPSRPYSCTPEFIQTLNENQKNQILQDITRSVQMMHHMVPPLPHRGLSPSNFVICKKGEDVSAVVCSFDSAKDLTGDSDFTVVNSNMLKKPERIAFVAPEILDGTAFEYRLLKSDIYSLGRIYEMIFSEEAIGYSLPECLTKEQKALIQSMTADDPDKRPDIDEVSLLLHRLLLGKPQYSVRSAIRKRLDQEDGFYVSGIKEHLADSISIDSEVKEFPVVLAVIDGMGGGEDGQEITLLNCAYLEEKDQELKDSVNINDTIQALQSTLKEMDLKTDEYIDKNNLNGGGAAAVIAILSEDNVYIGNCGDCRAYRYHGGILTQLSKDHRYTLSTGNKTELFQYIGSKAEGYTIDPYITQDEYKEGDVILLCSDGLTDILADEEIQAFLSGKTPLASCADAMMKEVRHKKGSDNITIILYAWGNRQ